MPQPRVQLLPMVVTPTGPGGALEARTDSTLLIRAFERERAGRAAIPPDPVVAFLDAILEDYGDEWLTKAMFHYRWVYPADIARPPHSCRAGAAPTWRRPRCARWAR